MENRIDNNRVKISNVNDVDITLFANEEVFIDSQSIDEIKKFTSITNTIEELKHKDYLPKDAKVERMVLTPDFHRGTGIPVGTVIKGQKFIMPKAIGNDIGCGMRFLTTDITYDEYLSLGKKLDDKLRYIFFEGGRHIPLSYNQRYAMFTNGISGLLEEKHSDDGIWKYWNQNQQEYDMKRTHKNGSFKSSDVYNLEEFMVGSGKEYTYDDQVGTIGGGNHFVEIQRTSNISDFYHSKEWNINSENINIMVHTGSASIGHIVGKHFIDKAKQDYPLGIPHPYKDFFMLNTESELGIKYISAMNNAANFAFVNRLFLGLMTVRAFSELLGREVEAKLVYDSPHNLIWEEDNSIVHRKGSCPAYGQTDDIFNTGHPVIIPGSMGANSFILRGNGLEDSLKSACHGAGRKYARKTGHAKKNPNISNLRVVTKIDPLRTRSDILKECMKSLMEEAPDMYKDCTPVIDTVTSSGIADVVATVEPLLTIKGI